MQRDGRRQVGLCPSAAGRVGGSQFTQVQRLAVFALHVGLQASRTLAPEVGRLLGVRRSSRRLILSSSRLRTS